MMTSHKCAPPHEHMGIYQGITNDSQVCAVKSKESVVNLTWVTSMNKPHRRDLGAVHFLSLRW